MTKTKSIAKPQKAIKPASNAEFAFKLKKGLRYCFVKEHSKEWYKFRKNGIGGSDISAIMGVNDYRSAVEVFYEKLGLHENKADNVYMFMGRYRENSVANLWQYWDGDMDSVVKNYNNKKKIRKARRVNAYVMNPKWHHLFASMDRRVVGEKKILECKTINGWAANKWKSGIPPSYVMQLQQYLLVTNWDGGELAMSIDGVNMKVYEFKKDEEIQKEILEASAEFWVRIEKARPLADKLLKIRESGVLGDEEIWDLEAKIQALEPAPDNSKAYEKFMSQKYLNRNEGKREGTRSEFKEGLGYNKTGENIKNLEKDKQWYKNQIISSMRGHEVLDFGAEGRITYRANKKGVKALRVNVKDITADK